MRFKHVYLLPLLLVTVKAFAGNPEVKWGKEMEVVRGKFTERIIGKTDETVFMLEYSVPSIFSSEKLYNISRYSSSNLNFKGTQVLLGKTNNPDYTKQQHEGIYKCGDKVFFFTSVYDKKKEKNLAFVQQADETGKSLGGQKKLDEIRSDSKRNRGDFKIFQSADSTMILIMNSPPYEKYANEKISLKIYGMDMKVLNSAEIKLPYKDKKFTIEKCQLAADGTVYMLACIELEKDDREKQQAEYFYNIISVPPGEEAEVNEFKIQLDKKRIDEVIFKLDKSGKNLLCVGFYEDLAKGYNGEIHGTFFLRINNKTQKIVAKDFHEFDRDLIEDMRTRRKAAKGHGISNSFQFKDFVVKDDGGIIISAEYSYDYIEITREKNNTGGTSRKRTYHYIRGSVLAYNFTSDGKIVWCVNIPKRQHTENDNAFYSSYALEYVNNKTYIIFNDHRKNINAAPGKRYREMPRISKAHTMLYQITQDGGVNKQVLADNRQEKYLIIPRMHYKLNDSELLLYSYKRGWSCCFIPFRKTMYKIGRLELM